MALLWINMAVNQNCLTPFSELPISNYMNESVANSLSTNTCSQTNKQDSQTDMTYIHIRKPFYLVTNTSKVTYLFPTMNLIQTLKDITKCTQLSNILSVNVTFLFLLFHTYYHGPNKEHSSL
jgi:hypothetical protein